jgi:hypothetical protein
MLGERSTGAGAAGRTVLVGVRRNPTMTGKNPEFVKLMTDYVRVVHEHGTEVDTDAWRLGLAVSAPHQAARQVSVLANLVRDHPDNVSFRAAVDALAATTARIRASGC